MGADVFHGSGVEDLDRALLRCVVVVGGGHVQPVAHHGAAVHVDDRTAIGRYELEHGHTTGAVVLRDDPVVHRIEVLRVHRHTLIGVKGVEGLVHGGGGRRGNGGRRGS